MLAIEMYAATNLFSSMVGVSVENITIIIKYLKFYPQTNKSFISFINMIKYINKRLKSMSF